MITNLREAKSQLSKLVQLANDGEEIIITVRGEPTARLTSVREVSKSLPDHVAWASELAENAEKIRVSEAKSTPQEYWDDLREG